MTDEFEVRIIRDDTSAGTRYHLTVWRNGFGSGLAGTFSRKDRAEKVRSCLIANLQPEWEREQRELWKLTGAGNAH